MSCTTTTAAAAAAATTQLLFRFSTMTDTVLLSRDKLNTNNAVLKGLSDIVKSHRQGRRTVSVTEQKRLFCYLKCKKVKTFHSVLII